MTLLLMQAWNWFKAHPNVRCAIFVVLALLVGAGLSFSFKPAKVVEHTKVVTQVQTKVEYKDRVVTQKVYVQAKTKHVHTETTTTKNKDGTTTTKTTKDENTNENTSTHATTDDQKQEVATKVETQIVEKEKLVLRQPDNRLYAGAGYQFATLAGSPETGLAGMKGAVVQIGYDRRLIGPVWLGLSVNTQYTAFLNLSVTF